MDSENIKDKFHRFIDEKWDEWAEKDTKETIEIAPEDIQVVGKVEDMGKGEPKDNNLRVVRTKSTGDKVYVLNEAEQTKRWVASPEVLKGLGFDMNDVEEVDDAEFIKYRQITL